MVILQQAIPGIHIDEAIDTAQTGDVGITVLVIGTIMILVATSCFVLFIAYFKTIQKEHTQSLKSAYEDALNAKNKDQEVLVSTLKEVTAALHTLIDRLRDMNEPILNNLADHDRRVIDAINMSKERIR
jgi:hypothetical protein